MEKERNDYLDKIEELKIKQEDFHRMEWQLKKREEEVLELQNLLSASNNNLNKERQISISYKNEVESTKSIYYLTELNQWMIEGDYFKFSNYQSH